MAELPPVVALLLFPMLLLWFSSGGESIQDTEQTESCILLL